MLRFDKLLSSTGMLKKIIAHVPFHIKIFINHKYIKFRNSRTSVGKLFKESYKTFYGNKSMLCIFLYVCMIVCVTVIMSDFNEVYNLAKYVLTMSYSWSLHWYMLCILSLDNEWFN